MKVLSIEIENFKNIKEKNVDLKGRPVFIVGDNGTGKTSFIQAIWLALTGNEVPSQPIKNGEKEAIITAKFGDANNQWEAELKFNASNPKGKLTVRDKNGKSMGSPRTLLDSLVGNISFDPFDFIRETPAKQIKFIKDFAGINTEALDVEKKQVFEDRASNNKDIKNLEGKIAESNVSESDLKSFTEIKPLDDIKKEISDVDVKNGKHNNGVTKLNELKNHKQSNSEKHAANLEEIDKLRLQIKALEEKNVAIVEANTTIDMRIAEGEQYILDNPMVSSTELNERYQKIISYNNRVKEVQSVQADMERCDDLKNISKQYTDRLKEIEEEKVAMIEKSKMPIKGLGFTDEYLTYNGLQLHPDQMPDSHIIEVGVEIGIAIAGPLKICRIKDGSLLGSKMYSVVDKLNKAGMQFFIEKVDEETTEMEIQIMEV